MNTYFVPSLFTSSLGSSPQGKALLNLATVALVRRLLECTTRCSIRANAGAANMATTRTRHTLSKSILVEKRVSSNERVRVRLKAGVESKTVVPEGRIVRQKGKAGRKECMSEWMGVNHGKKRPRISNGREGSEIRSQRKIQGHGRDGRGGENLPTPPTIHIIWDSLAG